MESASGIARALAHAPLEELGLLIDRHGGDPRATVASAVKRARRRQERELAVSYTHLTLPTILRV